jgi:hypothetical protein
MKQNKKLSALLFNKPPKVKEYSKLNLDKSIPVGHLLAVMCYDEGEHKETLFLDHIDVCKSHTVFGFNKNYQEVLNFAVDYSITTVFGATVYYKNNTNIEIIRIK